MDIKDTLKERNSQHGDFNHNALISQDLKDYARHRNGWNKLTPTQKEALDMVLFKVSRILSGGGNTADTWHDIAGYATLACNELNNED